MEPIPEGGKLNAPLTSALYTWNASLVRSSQRRMNVIYTRQTFAPFWNGRAPFHRDGTAAYATGTTGDEPSRQPVF